MIAKSRLRVCLSPSLLSIGSLLLSRDDFLVLERPVVFKNATLSIPRSLWKLN